MARRGTGMIIEGERQLAAALAASGPIATKAFAAAGVIEMEKVMAEAKAETPVDKGILRDSGHVLPPDIGATEVEITAGFGGAASAYAIVQHERLDYSHPSGNAKFLERPFLAAIPSMVSSLALGVRAALSRLGA